jgi:8-oxo-dGTP diphosphatase
MPGVGLGIIILDGSKVLLILRNSDAQIADSDMHLEGTWTLPAGKIKYGETIFEAAKRKVLQEVNLSIDDLSIVSIADDINEYAAFVTLGILANSYSGVIDLGNTLEHIDYNFFDMDSLPDNLCEPSKRILDNYRNKILYKEENKYGK